MSTSDIQHIVIVDDVVRFALHAWRYLGRAIGFGIGDISDDERRIFFGKRVPGSRRLKPVGLDTPDGRLKVWWIPARANWKRRLAEVWQEVDAPDQVWFVLDVKGANKRYNVAAVYDTTKDLLHNSLSDQNLEQRIWIVSSYVDQLDRVATRGPTTVWPKSPETLDRIERELDSGHGSVPKSRETTKEPAETPELIDILITGAGFETRLDLRFRRDGKPSSDTGIGLPNTAVLLQEMGYPFGTQGKASIRLSTKKAGYPYVAHKNISKGNQKSFKEDLERIAESRDLDAWWNIMLQTKLVERLSKARTDEERRTAKLEAGLFEFEMRESFRHAILRYDWGQMAASLFAARLPWRAWLTTNYTGFANRAIARTADEEALGGGRDSPSLAWRILSTADEAEWLSRELDDQEFEPQSGKIRREYRPLFKLHGDVAHVQTMAIAGYDKESFSGLAVPVRSLHHVYSAAEKYLLHALAKLPDAVVRWHIVGHGLRDQKLLRLMKTVVRERDNPGGQKECSRMRFILVSPQTPKETAKRLTKVIPESESSIEIMPATAEEYMSQLYRERMTSASPPKPHEGV